MELRIQETDGVFVPEDSLVRSFVGITGRTTLPLSDEFDDRDVERLVAEEVDVNASDGSIGNASVVERGEDAATVAWRAAVSLPHSRNWDVERVNEQAAEAVDPGSGSIRQVSYGYSRPAHDYPSERWREISDGDVGVSDEGPLVREQWVHSRLLLIVGIVELEVEHGDEPLYALVELAPPVPSPYDLSTYRAYDQLEVAQTQLKRYMMSVDGAFTSGEEAPVEAAREQFEFYGTEVESPTREDAVIDTTGDVEKTRMSSLPNRPLTTEEVDTVVESYESIADDGCTLLLPDEPSFVDEIVRKSQYVTEGDHVSFTVSTDDGFAVFELEDHERGLRWYRKEGNLDAE